LEPGERIVAAGRGRTVAGTDTADRLPPSTIWAASNRHLFVLDAAGRSRRTVPPPLFVYSLIDPPAAARVEPFDDRDELLVIDTPDGLAMVVMDRDDAAALAHAITTAAPASTGVVDVPSPTGSGSEIPDSPRAVGPRWSDPGDPSGGDARIADLRDALVRRDLPAVRSHFDGFGSGAEREWCVRHLTGTEIAGGLDDWVAADPGSAVARLARGTNSVWSAFARRASIGDEACWELLRQAEADLFASLELDFDEPVAFTPLVRSGFGLGIPVEELCMRFDESVRREPGLLGVHLETLLGLSPLGVGSLADSTVFARAVSDTAPAGSPLHVLVPLAHLIRFDLEPRGARRAATFSSEVIREVELARSLSVDHAAWVGGPGAAEVWNVFAMAAMRCGDPVAARRCVVESGAVRTFHPWSTLADGDTWYRTIVTAPD
jgi:hypothetical protein